MHSITKIICTWTCIPFLLIAAPFKTIAQDITVKPSIAIQGEYDDNVYYKRDFEIEDFITRIKPAITLDYATELLDLQSSFDADIHRYADETDLDTEDQHYSIDASCQMLERASVKGNFSYAKDTTLESELAETGLIVNTRHDRQRYIGGTGISYSISETSNLDVNYSHSKIDYDWTGNVDYDVDNISLSFNTFFNNQRDVFMVQPYYYRYDSNVSKTDNYGLSFGLQHVFTETLTLTAFAGARYTKTEYSFRVRLYENLGDLLIPRFTEIDEKDSNFAGVANIILNKTGETYSSEIGYNQDLSYSSYGEPIKRYKIHCNANRKITERFSMKFNGSIISTESEGKFNDRDNRYYSVIPSLNYKITENYSLNLAYRYSQSDDKTRSSDPRVDRNRVWLELRFRFPEKW